MTPQTERESHIDRRGEQGWKSRQERHGEGEREREREREQEQDWKR